MDGIIVVDKPPGWTSHDAVGKMRRLANTRKVGHLGTLDPMATGVLPLVIGRATRLAQFYVRSDKVYDARVRFGYSTDTYDAEGTATSVPVDPVLEREALEMKPVPVEVFDLKLLEIEGPEARFWAHCSAGTYMRSIAHELGQAMGCGAHLSALRRERSGDFSIDQARTIPALEVLAAGGRLAEALIPASALLPAFPAVIIAPATAG